MWPRHSEAPLGKGLIRVDPCLRDLLLPRGVECLGEKVLPAGYMDLTPKIKE
jgi:hypothetical protein